MEGISELSRLYGISKYDIRRRLYRSLGLSDLSRLKGMDARQIRIRLENILDNQQLSFLGIKDINPGVTTDLRDEGTHSLNLVA